jgi:hypothetical protein
MSAALSELKELATAIVTMPSKKPRAVIATHSREEMNLRPSITKVFHSGS